MDPISEPHRAARLARAIASDISVYHGDSIPQAIRDDAFFEALAEPIEEGLSHYKDRVAKSLDPNQQLYWKAIVDIVLFTRGDIESEIW